MGFFHRLKRGDRTAIEDVSLYGGLVVSAIASAPAIFAAAALFAVGKGSEVDFKALQDALGSISLFALFGFALIQRLRRYFANEHRKVGVRYKDKVAEFRASLARAKNPKVIEFYEANIRDLIHTLYCGEDYLPSISGDDLEIETLVAQVWNQSDAAQQKERVANVAKRLEALATKWDSDKGRPTYRVNSPHALAFNVSDHYEASPKGPKCINADFLTLLAIRGELLDSPGPASVPYVVGAGGFLVDPDESLVYVILRAEYSKEVDLLPNKYHVFGGNFEPNLKLPGRGYDPSLRVNASRELLEEAGVTVSVDDCLAVTHREHHKSDDPRSALNVTFWLSTFFCGVVIPLEYREQLRTANGSAEGDPVPIKLNEIDDYLRQPQKWVPLGWYTIMLWLYLGAPCQGGEPVLSRREARRLFDRVLAM